MKSLVLFFLLLSFSQAVELDFKKSSLEEFKLEGLSSKIVYKDKVDRDLQIAKLWEKFFSSKSFDIKKSIDKKLYVVYSNYKKNSFDCFIGVKSKEQIKGFTSKTINKSNYQKGLLKYENNMNVSKVWDDIQAKKLSRNFKTDIEQYELIDLQKSSYFINIYLSMN